jgi:hypothetical protein
MGEKPERLIYVDPPYLSQRFLCRIALGGSRPLRRSAHSPHSTELCCGSILAFTGGVVL